MQARWKSGLDLISCSLLIIDWVKEKPRGWRGTSIAGLMVSYSALDGCGGYIGQFVPHEGGIGGGHFLDLGQDGSADQIRAGLEKFSSQGLGISVDHGNGEAGLGIFKIVLHLDGDADFYKLTHAGGTSFLAERHSPMVYSSV